MSRNLFSGVSANDNSKSTFLELICIFIDISLPLAGWDEYKTSENANANARRNLFLLNIYYYS
jgi:hypothetical protein